jgi:hypothetical protein
MTGMITTEIGIVGTIAIGGIGTIMLEETGTIGTTVTGIKTEVDENEDQACFLI